MSDSEPELPEEKSASGETPAPMKNPTPVEAATELARTEPPEFKGLLGGWDGIEEESTNPPHARMARGEMGFLDHLEELRAVILKSLTAAFIGMAVVGIFFTKFFELLRWPLVRALGDNMAATSLITTAPMAVFSLVIQVAVFGGVLLALPFIIYHIKGFVAPGLTLREKGMLRPALAAAFLLFLLGAAGCFFIMLPAGLKAAYFLNKKLGITMMLTATEYYSLVVWATLGVGLVFEFPLILVILQTLGVVETNTLRRGRRYAILVIAIVGGLIAPTPDPVSLLMTATPMLLLYEGSLIVGERLRKRHLAKAAARAAADAG